MSSPTFLGKYEKWSPPSNPKGLLRWRAQINIPSSQMQQLKSCLIQIQCLTANRSSKAFPTQPPNLSWVSPHSFVHPLLDATFGASDDNQTRHNETMRLSGPGLQKGSRPFATGWPVRLCALSVCISVKMCFLEFEPHGMPGLLSPVACRPASWRCLQKSQEQESLKPKHLKPQCHFNALLNCKKELEAG